MRTEKARRIFRALYGYTFYLLFMETFLLSTKQPAVTWISWIAMGVLFLCSYLLRDLVLHVWPIILYSVLAGVILWFMPISNHETWLLIGLDVGLMFTSCHYIRRGGILSDPQDIPWPIFVMGLLATVFGLVYNIEGLPWIAAILTGVGLIFFLLILYADGTQKYIDSTRDVRGIPIRQILKVNSWIIVGIFLCMIVVILLGEAVNLPDAFVGFLQAALGILKIIFYGLLLAIKWFGQLFGFTSSQSVNKTAQQLKQSASNPSTYINVLEFVLKGALLILAVVVILKLIAWLIRTISAKYHRKTGAEQVVEMKRSDVRERIDHPSLFQRMRDYMSMEERARRIYRKRIMDLVKQDLPRDYETTADIEARIREQAGVALPELTQLYNRVRYGSVTIDKEYLARMKHADGG